MNSRERVHRIIDREPVDQIAIFDSFWTEVRDDFHAQGVPKDTTIEVYFNFDIGMV
jgi:hypothetical protein